MRIHNRCNILPNLHNIGMHCEAILNHSETVVNKFKIANENSDVDCFELSFEVFLQTWANTSCGLTLNESDFSGQAITDSYTVVCHEIVTDSYIVFFGNYVGYLVTDASKEFLSDLMNHDLKGINYAKIHY